MRKAALFLACLLCFTHLAGCTATPVVSDLPADTTGVTSTTAEESPAGTAGSSTAGVTEGMTASGTSSAILPSSGQTTTGGTGTTAASAPAGTTATAAQTGHVGTTASTATANPTSTTATVQPVTTTTVRTVTLPTPGYDPDGKNRIRLGEVTLEGSTVTMVVKNTSTAWVTDEDTFFDYVCYDAAGKELLRGTIYCGAISTGKQRTCLFTIPVDIAKVELTGFTTTYWTEWKK